MNRNGLAGELDVASIEHPQQTGAEGLKRLLSERGKNQVVIWGLRCIGQKLSSPVILPNFRVTEKQDVAVTDIREFARYIGHFLQCREWQNSCTGVKE